MKNHNEQTYSYDIHDKRCSGPQEYKATAVRVAKVKKMLAQRYSDVCVVLEDIFNPHNANAVFRSCDVFGVQNVHIVFRQVPFYDPLKIEKHASTAFGKWITTHTYDHPDELINILRDENYKIITTVVPDQAEQDLMHTDLTTEKLAFVLGNEQRGVSDEFLAAADYKLSIPMLGMVQSMNISVAAGIFLYEMHRQRVSKNIKYPFNKQQTRQLLDSFVK